MKRFTIALILLFMPLVIAHGEAVSKKSYDKRVELLTYLRELEPIVMNFRGENDKGEMAPFHAPEGQKGERVKKYEAVKSLYQEGLIYFFEGQYVNAYRSFIEAQIGIEQMLEEISHLYVIRAEKMMKAAVEKKNQNNPEDRNLVDISVEYGRDAYIRQIQKKPRQAPFERRMYNPRMFHYVVNKYQIERNMELGYKFLGESKEARLEAMKIEKYLADHQELQPRQRKYRIEKYFASINLARDAKANAANIFKLKYPYDNYYLWNDKAISSDKPPQETVKMEGITMDFTKNPYVDLDHLSPVFDRRIPEEYRRDATDISGKVFDEEVETRVQLKWEPEKQKELIPNLPPENNGANAQNQSQAGGTQGN